MPFTEEQGPFYQDVATVSHFIGNPVSLDEAVWLVAELGRYADLAAAEPARLVPQLMTAFGCAADVTAYSECDVSDLVSITDRVLLTLPKTQGDVATLWWLDRVAGDKIVLRQRGDVLTIQMKDLTARWDGQCVTVSLDASHPPNRLWHALLRKRFVPRDDDIFVTTCPKAGTTVCQTIVCSIVSPEKLLAGESLHDVSPYYDALTAPPMSTTYADLPSPRCFKTHFPLWFLPSEGRHIVVMRSPAEVLASGARHYLTHDTTGRLSWQEALERSMVWILGVGDVEPSPESWVSHVIANFPRRDESNVLLLQYREITKDPESAVTKVARFLGRQLSDHELNRCIELSSLERMRANWRTFAPPVEGVQSEDFFRKSPTSDWRAIGKEGVLACLDAIELVLAELKLARDHAELGFFDIPLLEGYLQQQVGES